MATPAIQGHEAIMPTGRETKQLGTTVVTAAHPLYSIII